MVQGRSQQRHRDVPVFPECSGAVMLIIHCIGANKLQMRCISFEYYLLYVGLSICHFPQPLPLGFAVCPCAPVCLSGLAVL